MVPCILEYHLLSYCFRTSPSNGPRASTCAASRPQQLGNQDWAPRHFFSGMQGAEVLPRGRPQLHGGRGAQRDVVSVPQTKKTSFARASSFCLQAPRVLKSFARASKRPRPSGCSGLVVKVLTCLAKASATNPAANTADGMAFHENFTASRWPR